MRMRSSFQTEKKMTKFTLKMMTIMIFSTQNLCSITSTHLQSGTTKTIRTVVQRMMMSA